MYVKVVTTRTKSKTYRYIKIVEAVWTFGKSTERIIGTMGPLEDVLKSRDTIISGLMALSPESPPGTSRQNKGTARRLQGPDRDLQPHRTKAGSGSTRSTGKPVKNSCGKSAGRRRFRSGATPDKKYRATDKTVIRPVNRGYRQKQGANQR
jgi:hypothetical protein